MSSSQHTAERSGAGSILPASAPRFLKARLVDLAGLALLVLGAAILVALIDYHPGDPSPNKAVPDAAGNLLGLPGAYVADILLQALGLAAAIVGLTPLAWGLRVLFQRRLSRPGLRFLSVLAGLALLATALDVLPPPDFWPLAAGLGGFAGELALGGASELLGVAAETATGAEAGIAPWMVALAAAVLGIVFASYGLALGWRDWGRAARGLATLLLLPLRLVRRAERGVDADQAGALRRQERAARRTDGKTAAGDGPRLSRQEAGDQSDADQNAAAKPVRAAKATGGKNQGAGDDEAIVAPAARSVRPGKRATQDAQGRLDLGTSDFDLPPLSLLARPKPAGKDAMTRDALEKNARLLESVLQDFGVKGEIVKVRPGPVVTRYELEPAPGTKTNRVVGLADDIARSMSAVSVRVAVVPGSSVIGIELPNSRRETVYLAELLASEDYEKAGGKLPLILGKDISGNPNIADLAKMPHLLVAGTTGSGKSVAVNVMILSLVYRLTPEQCRFIMIDPKMLELSIYDDIPHLLSPVVTDPKKAVVALKWTVREMEDRYRAMSKLGVRNIDGYNARIEEARRKGEVLTRKVQTGFDPDTGKPVTEEQAFELTPLPQIVVIVDEMADLMLVAGKDIEAAVQRLAQMARAAGIHLIMATQRPSVDVVTGTIKANFPTRISFHVTSKIDSRTILGEIGAEQLLGQGDMLFMGSGGRIIRVHGPLVTDQEVESVVRHLKAQGTPDYIEDVTEEDDVESSFLDMVSGGGDSDGDLYAQALAVICQHQKASTSFVQRQLQIGYNRAARLIERMESDGAVSAANHVGKREVLIRSPDDVLS